MTGELDVGEVETLLASVRLGVEGSGEDRRKDLMNRGSKCSYLVEPQRWAQ